MRRAKQTILSMLLFVFSSFVVHDYIIVDADADTQYELCYLQCDKSVLDLPSQVHDHIHILLSALPIEEERLPMPLHSVRPAGYLTVLRSRTTSVLQRPPLN